MGDVFDSGENNEDTLVVRQDPASGTSNNAALFVQRLAALGKGLALRVFTAGGSSARFEGGPVEVVATSGTKLNSELPHGRPGTVGDTGIDVLSSFAGGEDDGTGTDSTGRINLYSYQRAQTGSFGENIRHFMMRKDAKSMDAWYFPVTTDGTLSSGYDDATRDPKNNGIKWTPAAWTGAHWEANDHNSLHMHWELEIPDSTGALQGRIVVPFGDTSTGKLGLDKTNIGINQADLTMYASSGLIRVAGSTSYNKEIEFSLDISGGTSYRRWKLRGADATAESGNNVGSNFAIFRYADDGTINSTPVVKLLRNNGNVGINKTTPVAALDIVGTAAVSGNALGIFKPNDQSFAAWAYDPALIVNSHATTSGTMYLIKQQIAADTSVTKLQYYVSVVASSVTSGQNFAGLYSSSGTLLQSVGIDSDLTSTGLKTATITSQALTAGSYVWVALLFNAGAAPNIGRMGGLANIATVVNANLLASQYRFATSGTGQTALPSSITPANNVAGNPVWAAIG